MLKPNKVILLNPYLDIKVPEGTTYLDLEITITDFTWNEYEPVKLNNIIIKSPKELVVRLTDLLSFNGDD